MVLKVLYLTGYSSENQLSAPIIRRMKADPYFEVDVLDVRYRMTLEFEHWNKAVSEVDVIVVPCDRVEQLQPAIDAFFANKIIVRIYAGINTSGGTHDDVIRRMLDSMGHILMAESEECRQNLIRQGEEEWRIPPPFGLTHLDDIEPDYRACPASPYALFLMNPVTVSKEETIKECYDAMDRAIQFSKQTNYVIFLPPNGDTNSDEITRIIYKLSHELGTKALIYDERGDRNWFLGLLAKCALYISNSSNVFYEAPALGVENIYNPSWRNQERTHPPKLEMGGSDRIISVLKNVDWKDTNLLRKRFHY